jgi:hypothetical protein
MNSTKVLLGVVLLLAAGCGGSSFTETSPDVSLEAGPVGLGADAVIADDAGARSDGSQEAAADGGEGHVDAGKADAADTIDVADAADAAVDAGLPDNWSAPATATYVCNQNASTCEVATAGVANTCNAVQPCCAGLGTAALAGNPYTPMECVAAVVANDAGTCLAMCDVLRRFNQCAFQALGTGAPDPCGQAYP